MNIKIYFSDNIFKIILFLLIIIAGIFRINGINWDQGYHLHPDERMLVMVTERIHLPVDLKTFLSPASPLNPQFFPYGSFPIYFLKFVSNITAIILGNPLYSNYSMINIVGRFLSALFDLGTIFLLFKLGQKVFSKNVGLLASFLYAFCVFPIQLSHFFAVDTFLTFFVIAAIYRLVIFYEKPSFNNALLIGLLFGLSLATKVSATVLLASIGTALIMDLFLVIIKRTRLFLKHKKIFYSSDQKITIIKSKLRKLLFYFLSSGKYLLIIAAVSIIIFVVCEPYAVIDFPTFWRQTKEQQAMTKSAYTFPYTLQYVGTAPYIYPLKNMILWGMGIPLGLISCASIFYFVFYLLKEFPKPGNEKQEALILIILSFFFAYFFVVGNFAVKFMRYMLPLYPIFILLASSLIVKIINKNRKLLPVFVVFVFLPTILWALSFSAIYFRPHSRVQASTWINSNIPQGSALAIEHWDDSLPLFGGEKYQFLEMPMYEDDQSIIKWEKVNSNLEKADYIILTSNRLYVPLQKLSDCTKYKRCFPKTAQYYRDLFSGKLGFEKVAEFFSYPQFQIPSASWRIKFQINDSSADESFTVYDHPKVIIFKKK